MKEKYHWSVRIGAETCLFVVFALTAYTSLSFLSPSELGLFDGVLIGFLARMFSAMPAEVRYEM